MDMSPRPNFRLLNPCQKRADELGHLIGRLDTVPMPDPLQDRQALGRAAQLAENMLTPRQRRALVLLPGDDQHGNLDVPVVRRFRTL